MITQQDFKLAHVWDEDLVKEGMHLVSKSIIDSRRCYSVLDESTFEPIASMLTDCVVEGLSDDATPVDMR